MQLKHLRTFVCVANTLNLTRAGEKLHLSQSSVTEQIQSLENDLGTPLFDRAGRRWTLTAAGTRLLDYATAIIALNEEARSAVTDETASIAGRVAIGGIETLCAERLPLLLLRYCADFPQVAVTLRAGKTTDLHGSLKTGLLDVYFTFGDTAEEADVRSERVASEQIVLVGPPDHPLVGRGDVTLGDLAQAQFLVTIDGCPLRAAFDEAFDRHGDRPPIVAEFASPVAMRRMAEEGAGCALIPESAARESLTAGRLVALSWPARREIPVSMRWRQKRALPPALREFLQMARVRLAA
jgi:DNA-binding transcriptional LysR family regulator